MDAPQGERVPRTAHHPGVHAESANGSARTRVASFAGHQQLLTTNKPKRGSTNKKGAQAATRRGAERAEHIEGTLERGKDRLGLLAASMGEWPRECTVLTDSANAEGWSQGSRIWKQLESSTLAQVTELAGAMHALWETGERPLGGGTASRGCRGS